MTDISVQEEPANAKMKPMRGMRASPVSPNTKKDPAETVRQPLVYSIASSAERKSLLGPMVQIEHVERGTVDLAKRQAANLTVS